MGLFLDALPRRSRVLGSCVLAMLWACDEAPALNLPPLPATGIRAEADGGAARPGDADRSVTSNTGVDGQSASAADGPEEDAGTPQPNGGSCRVDSDCQSDHCRHDVCCESGECCADVKDCAEGGGVALVCKDPSGCKGERGAAACVAFSCTVLNGMEDDSACDERVIADECGPYAPVFCNGEADQRPPRCPDTCGDDGDCDRDAHCDSTCLPDVVKGGACDENSDCASGECNGGRCCEAGNCTRDLNAVPEVLERQCLDTLASDACSTCGCTQCTQAMLGCYNSGNESRDQLCSTLLECAFRESCFDACRPGEGCFRDECWCGTTCESPYGSCTRPIQSAAGGADSKASLAQRALDPKLALYHAERYGECLNANCRAECGL